MTVAELDHILASAQFFLGVGSFFGSKSAEHWKAQVVELRKANNEALVVELLPIIEDAVKINTPIVQRVVATIKKHSK